MEVPANQASPGTKGQQKSAQVTKRRAGALSVQLGRPDPQDRMGLQEIPVPDEQMDRLGSLEDRGSQEKLGHLAMSELTAPPDLLDCQEIPEFREYVPRGNQAPKGREVCPGQPERGERLERKSKWNY